MIMLSLQKVYSGKHKLGLPVVVTAVMQSCAVIAAAPNRTSAVTATNVHNTAGKQYSSRLIFPRGAATHLAAT